MKAILCAEFAPIEALQLGELEPPTLNTGQVRIEVHACGINFPDILMVQGKYQVKPPLPFVPGGEIAGVITEMAADVKQFEVGQRVMVTTFFGGLCEQVIAAADNVVAIPDHLDFLVGSVFQGGHTTSYYALKQRGQLKAGETLLVLGAAGGVGLAAVQLGRAMGARVIAAVGSEEKRSCVLSNGADESINYTSEDLKTRAKELTDGRGADVIFDPVGGDQFDQAVRAINAEGRILIIGFASGRIPQYGVNLALLKSCAVVGVNYQHFFANDRARVNENFDELLAMFAEKKICPIIDKVFPLEQAADALQYVADRKAVGKVVVQVRSE